MFRSGIVAYNTCQAQRSAPWRGGTVVGSGADGRFVVVILRCILQSLQVGRQVVAGVSAHTSVSSIHSSAHFSIHYSARFSIHSSIHSRTPNAVR